MTERSQKALSGVRFYPFWLDSDDAPEPNPPLNGIIDTELLVVGAGFTGLWSAILAKENYPDKKVVVIDSNTVAFGASGRPGAIVSTSVMHGLHVASNIFPKDIHILEKLGRENMKGFRDSIDRYQIDCDAEWSGELTVSVGTGGVAMVKEEFTLHKEFGHDVELFDQNGVREQLNSPLFRGGFWSKKKAAMSLGVEIYENTALNRVVEEGSLLRVHTTNGEIRTQKAMLCTNAFAAGHRKIRQRVAMIRDRILMTEPLTDDQLDRIGWRNRQGVYDTRTQLNYMRLTKDNRMLFGGRLGYFMGGNPDPKKDKTSKPYIRLADAFFETFPQLDDVRFSHAWSGPIALTTRMAVHFQSYYNGKAIYAGGYSGFGVSSSRFGAEMGLAKLFEEDRSELDLDFARTLPRWIPPEPFRYLGSQITMYALDTADKNGGWRIWWLKAVDKMGFPLSWTNGGENSD